MDGVDVNITRGTVTVAVKIYPKDSAWKRLYIAVKDPMGKVLGEMDVNLQHMDDITTALDAASDAVFQLVDLSEGRMK